MTWWPAPLGSKRSATIVLVLIVIAVVLGVVFGGYGDCC
jgi:hypothetical protein